MLIGVDVVVHDGVYDDITMELDNCACRLDRVRENWKDSLNANDVSRRTYWRRCVCDNYGKLKLTLLDIQDEVTDVCTGWSRIAD